MEYSIIERSLSDRGDSIIDFLENGKKLSAIYFNDRWWRYPNFSPLSTAAEDFLKDNMGWDISTLSNNNYNEEYDDAKYNLFYENNKFKFVIATPKSKGKFFISSGLSAEDVLVIYNNKEGLSKVYNQQLHDPKNKGKFLVFLHDDVLVEDSNLINKLTNAHKEYDIVGLAGSKRAEVKSPCMWHLMTPNKSWNNQGDLRGFVSHILPNGDSNMSYFGNSPAEVEVIDGLFISVNVDKVLDAGVEFDEDFDFHFYDLAFCKRVKNAGLSIGVWPIFVRHYGLGHTDDNWKALEPRFIEKYS